MGVMKGSLFIPFCYYEAAANLLTNSALDPVGKIPEFKFCAVKVTVGGEVLGRGGSTQPSALPEHAA